MLLLDVDEDETPEPRDPPLISGWSWLDRVLDRWFTKLASWADRVDDDDAR